jgi:copper oxidase (laccase) domain-containing protein
MLEHVSRGLSYYSFEILRPYPELSHGVFGRKGPEGDFNLSYEHGETSLVNRNLSLAEELLGLPPASFVNQAHGANILELKDGEVYAPRSPSETLGGYDAIIGGPGTNLMVKLADCQGVLLYSPERKVLAMVHSGWRGSALGIVSLAAERMVRAYGADPEGMLAAVSPSIGPCCMEFKSYERDLPPELWRYRVGESFYFDFWAATKDELLRAGLSPSRIEFSGLCTLCGGGFFSHRAGDTGRFAFMAGLING